MKTCKICGHKKVLNADSSLFRIPSNESRRQQWSNITGKTLTRRDYICEKHFEAKYVLTYPLNNSHFVRRLLISGAIPSLNLGPESNYSDGHQPPFPIPHRQYGSSQRKTVVPVKQPIREIHSNQNSNPTPNIDHPSSPLSVERCDIDDPRLIQYPIGQESDDDDEVNDDEGNKEKEPIRNEDIERYPVTYTEKHSVNCKDHQECQKAFKVWFQYSLTKYEKTGCQERLTVNRSKKTCDMYFESNTGVEMAEELYRLLRRQTEIGEPPSSAIPDTQANDETGPAENEPNALPTDAYQIGLPTNEKTSADDVWLVPETAAKTLLMFETEDLGVVEERKIVQDTTDDEYKVMKKVLIKGLRRLPVDWPAGDESSSVHVCRICLDSVIPSEEAVALSLESPATVGVANETGEMKDLSVLDMISVVLPRMQMKPNMKTVLCENCVVSLHTSYQLKMRWIETEIKLQAYLEQKNLSYDVEYELPGSSMECQKSEESQANIQGNATLQEETVDSPDGVLPNLSAPSSSEQPPMTGEQSEHSPNTELNNEALEWQFCELDPKIILSSNLKRSKWGGGPYLCSECGKVFENVKSFKRHVHGSCDKSPKTRVCEFCGLVFVNKSKFFKHRQRHSTKNRCSTCSKVLCSKQALEAHVNNIHLATPERRAQCEHCGKTFKHQYGLGVHLNAHRNHASRYRCEHCGQSFICRKDLSTHRKRIHSSDLRQPKMCDFCGKLLYNEQNLRKHRMIYHMVSGGNRCQHCGKAYWHKRHLIQHLWKVHNELRNAGTTSES